MWHPESGSKKSAMAKAEDLFNKAQKNKHALSDIEKAKQAEREKNGSSQSISPSQKFNLNGFVVYG